MGQPVTLASLFPDAELSAPSRGIHVAGLTADSREVGPGFVFAALPGVKADGMLYAAAAAAAGAVAVLTESSDPVPAGMVPVRVPNARASLARAAARFYPAQPDIVVAVTGTNGKTSVASFLRQIWTALGHKAASLGTVGLVSPSGEVYSNLTTPDPVKLHRIADELCREGVTHLALEASSHGLDQSRLSGMRLSAGGFTNLTRDHLDYHATFTDYRAAKLRLFTEVLPEGAGAVICVDGANGEIFAEAARQRGLELLTVGSAGLGIHLLASEPAGFAQRLVVRHCDLDYSFLLPLAGVFQAENALVAAGLAIITGGEPADVFTALEGLTGASGRLERVASHGGAEILVDYAHTPDALENALLSLRPFTRNRLIVVFGAGGDRDPGKRPLMGTVAARHADVAIVTDDNPRSEDPAGIRSQIIAAAPGAFEIGDRAEAIGTAIGSLQDGDVLLVAGKGHETGQIVGDRTLPFSDQAAIRAAIAGAT
ncbi:UDP-N-acetylmuramoyl-L-alanyl-D-glutamate--2,6-diaminopimelate ligase [Terrihabitans rhizophilus]|uniref:UDP-N-acetylmuramoyl-L-alanyl-D-glutamate--2,6-diaminopimelate ligase n=1 Tax=Terrihabitans rhizophilus TaxID=3092662 RepID=A0ABU4RNB0_9HYPH|nr:UDP-N-acetylmuramoyl-L-alanyl-D-glutamate--2,6-diaminopimelate ligase [Terrihabitans sp. PJ23]MDX6805599.1 UDP-N-acetylmuramoyl-L-alanyl-D-glutamate--2,6-diaminopimelate ligase [Terrihabitans sp. PJ23]